jgi:hypothetical protein
MCVCGFGTNDPAWLEDHLFDNPVGHRERTLERLLRLVMNAR